MRRSDTAFVALVHALVLLTTVGQVAIVPMLPRLAERFGVGAIDVGWLLASTSVATLLVAVPAGLLADRFGSRRITLAAGWLLVAGTVTQAFAPTFAALVAGRLCFGAAYGCVWTTALAWMAAAYRGEAGDRPLAAATTSAGVGLMAGPAFGAVTSARLGLAAPFLLLAVTCSIVTALLGLIQRSAVAAPPPSRSSFLKRPGAARPTPALRASILAIGLVGLTTSTVNLVVPLELHARGISTEAIGIVFAGASVIYIAVSGAVVRLGSALLRTRTIVVLVTGIAVALSPAVASASALALLGALALYTLPRAALATVSYPLATADGRYAGVATGAVLGLLNAAWAGASSTGPLLAGALFQAGGARWSFGVLSAVALAVAAAMCGEHTTR